jgi:anamorsin
VCGTTGKRKACKDCSCGLAEELAAEKGEISNSSKTATSSCGSVRRILCEKIWELNYI